MLGDISDISSLFPDASSLVVYADSLSKYMYVDTAIHVLLWHYYLSLFMMTFCIIVGMFYLRKMDLNDTLPGTCRLVRTA